MMSVRRARIAQGVGAVGLAVAATVWAAPGGPPSGTRLTIWTLAPGAEVGGAENGALSYGGGHGGTPPAYVTERRTLEVAAGSAVELRLPGVSPVLDPTSVQLRDLADPSELAVSAQRFQPGARTPVELLRRGIGATVTAVTAKGEVSGVLRAVDDTTLAIETATGLAILERGDYVRDVRIAGLKDVGAPALAWRVAARRAGAHDVEVGYRTDDLAWTADYTAIVGDHETVDFQALAGIRNDTGARFADAIVTLAQRDRPSIALAAPVTLGEHELVHVALAPPRVGVHARAVVEFEAVVDQSGSYRDFPNTECTAVGLADGAAGAQTALELDVPPGTPLPPGRLRVWRRAGTLTELASEGQLVVGAGGGVVRLRLGKTHDVEGERRAVGCDLDEQARTLKERVEVVVHNKSARALDVVVREYLWRSPLYKLDVPGWRRAGDGAVEEKRLHVAAGASATWAYSVAYSWN